jgi:hypothetical protein
MEGSGSGTGTGTGSRSGSGSESVQIITVPYSDLEGPKTYGSYGSGSGHIGKNYR